MAYLVSSFPFPLKGETYYKIMGYLVPGGDAMHCVPYPKKGNLL